MSNNNNELLCAHMIILIVILLGAYAYVLNIQKDTEIISLKTELNTINITIATENLRRSK